MFFPLLDHNPVIYGLIWKWIFWLRDRCKYSAFPQNLIPQWQYGIPLLQYSNGYCAGFSPDFLTDISK